jgi:hypothetical protein
MFHNAWAELIVLLLAFALARAGVSFGAEFFVAPGGSDNNPGTREAPFATIRKAAEALQPGDTCVLRAGTYRETVRPAHSGEAGKPIKFVAAQGENVVITGADLVTGWAAHQGKIHVAAVDWPVEQVFVERRWMVPARHPNAGPDPYKPPLLDLEGAGDVATGAGLDQPKDHWKGATVWALDKRLGWVAQTYAVTGSEPGKLFFSGRKGWWRDGGARGCLTNLLSTLDAENEWHAEAGKLYLWPPGGVDPDKLTIEATRRRFTFDLADRAFVEFHGLRFFAGSVNLDRAADCLFDDCHFRWPSFDRLLKGGFNRDRGIAPQTEGLGIVMGGARNVIRNSTVAYGTGDGISVFGENNTVENCIVHDFDYSASDCAPINCTGPGHAILRCTLFNGGRSILVHRKLARGRIEFNHMYNAGLMTNDLGMTYTYQTDSQGTTIAYNVIHHNHGRAPGNVGIYLDDLSRGHVVHHNLVYEVSEALAMNPPQSQRNLIYNNTLDGYNVSLGMSQRRPQDMTGSQLKNNIFFTKLPNCPNAELSNNVFHKETDAKFVDREKRDYRLREGSPAIDAGAVLPPYTDGFTGKAPDCGAFEFGREPWQAGSTLEAKLAE